MNPKPKAKAWEYRANVIERDDMCKYLAYPKTLKEYRDDTEGLSHRQCVETIQEQPKLIKTIHILLIRLR